MNINGWNTSESAKVEAGRAAGAPQVTQDKSGRSGQVRAGDGDRVEVSGLAQSISQALASNGVDRAARVERLAAEYRAGRYAVDNQSVSEALVSASLGAGEGEAGPGAASV